jgi:polyhydroxybutyrate depolymerase
VTAHRLEERALVFDGITRSYAVASDSPASGPLLLVFHGQGITPALMAEWTGLAERGPAAGFVTVFPNAVGYVWDDTGLGRVDGLDDGRFVTALVKELGAGQDSGDRDVVLVGLSNGATFAEHLARHGVVRVKGVALVAGTARVASRRTAVRPMQQCAVLCVAGTADPNVPYAGGRASGVTGWMARRRPSKHLLHGEGRDSVGLETLAADWVDLNDCGPTIETSSITVESGDLPVEKVAWPCRDGRQVVLYRIVGGGHGWPGGPQYAPRFMIGRISRSFDATTAVVDFARDLVQE